ncbi:MAG TPA: STAS domain-containing protein [Longimicrobiales bacterium]
MDALARSRIPTVLERDRDHLLDAWVRQQTVDGFRSDLISETDLKQQSREVLRAIADAVRAGAGTDVRAAAWKDVRALLSDVSGARAQRGFSPAETASFVFSLKQPVFTQLNEEWKDDPAGLARDVWTATELLDGLGLVTVEAHQKARELVIRRQQQELLELSTPVVKIWDGVLAVPLIGTLDSARTQVVMEALLGEIVASGAGIAIMDITGVPTVDTLVAQHLLKTIAAARLMGADVIVSGIRPQIAQTMVHLGVNLENVTTRASLADAIALALRSAGWSVVRSAKAQ